MPSSPSLLDYITTYGFALFVIIYTAYVLSQVQKYRKGPEAQNVPSSLKNKLSSFFGLITKNISIITNLGYLAFMIGGLVVFVTSRVSWSLFDYVIIIAFSAVLIIFFIYGLLPRFRTILKSKPKKND
jgi:hypothetical protein